MLLLLILKLNLYFNKRYWNDSLIKFSFDSAGTGPLGKYVWDHAQKRGYILHDHGWEGEFILC